MKFITRSPIINLSGPLIWMIMVIVLICFICNIFHYFANSCCNSLRGGDLSGLYVILLLDFFT